MNNNNNNAAANAISTTVSEYHIGHTLYTVTTVFNPASKESLSDILKRLITRDCENLLGDTEQEQGNRCKF